MSLRYEFFFFFFFFIPIGLLILLMGKPHFLSIRVLPLHLVGLELQGWGVTMLVSIPRVPLRFTLGYVEVGLLARILPAETVHVHAVSRGLWRRGILRFSHFSECEKMLYD